MDLRNNSFSLDNIASLIFRMKLLSSNINLFADDLGINDEEIANIMNIAGLLLNFANSEHKEKADVASIYAGLRHEEAKTRKQLYACRKFLRGELVFADESTSDYIEERFMLGKKLPKGRSEFIDMAKNMLEAFETIGEELPGITLPALPFDRLRDQMESLKAFHDRVQRERAERRAASTRLNQIRKECVKTMRWVYFRAVSYWGVDEPRLLQLGIVNKSSIWTKKKPKPPKDEG